jgi:hypothetical protein
MEVPPKVSVSITSAPASKKPRWTLATASGLVITKYSLQPSYSGPPKSVSGEVLHLQVRSHRAIKHDDGAAGLWRCSRKALFMARKAGWIGRGQAIENSRNPHFDTLLRLGNRGLPAYGSRVVTPCCGLSASRRDCSDGDGAIEGYSECSKSAGTRIFSPCLFAARSPSLC